MRKGSVLCPGVGWERGDELGEMCGSGLSVVGGEHGSMWWLWG